MNGKIAVLADGSRQIIRLSRTLRLFELYCQIPAMSERAKICHNPRLADVDTGTGTDTQCLHRAGSCFLHNKSNRSDCHVCTFLDGPSFLHAH
ncbi:MAG TPA: hypothetical protein VI140_09075, partial [Oxalicibacterium sp.]